jgi:photosystem II stability/assembly factor-like uncharacterized protein
MFLPRMCGIVIGRVAWIRAYAALSLVFQASTRVLPAQVWRSLGPFGGPMEVVAAHPRAGGLLLAASHHGVLFSSSNGGDAWRAVGFPAAFQSALHTIWMNPADPRHWLVGVSQDHGGSGLYQTNDAGATWRPEPTFAGRVVYSLASTSPRWLAAGTDDGVWRSPDAGQSWNRISPPNHPELRPVVSLAFHPADPKVLLAGTTHLPWRTADGGQRWESVHAGMLDDSDVFSIAVDSTRPDRIWASACSGMYRSLNGGRSWTRLRGSADASFRTYVIAQDPRQPDRLLAGTTHGLLRSTDGGATWRKTRAETVKSAAFDAVKPDRAYIASPAGLFRSDDGGATFQKIHNGYTTWSLHTMVASRTGLRVAGLGDPWWSGDGGATWTRDSSGTTDRNRSVLAASVCSTNPDLIVIAGRDAVETSRNSGAKWTPLPPPVPRPAATAVLASPDRVWIALREGVFAGSWNGTSWVRMRPPGNEPVRLLAELAPRIIAAEPRRAVISNDGGKSWRAFAQPLPAAEWYGFAATGSTLLSATSHGLFRSRDEGRSWVRCEELGADTISTITSHPLRAEVLFAAQFGTVWVSTSGGGTWRRLAQQRIEHTAVRNIAVLTTYPDRVYVLTSNRGVFVTEWQK